MGFDQLEFAAYALILLNADMTKRFLQSVTFSDAKRTFTKDVLMRIDLAQIAAKLGWETIRSESGFHESGGWRIVKG